MTDTTGMHGTERRYWEAANRAELTRRAEQHAKFGRYNTFRLMRAYSVRIGA